MLARYHPGSSLIPIIAACRMVATAGCNVENFHPCDLAPMPAGD